MSIHDEARRGFQAGAAAYERGRPGYPRAAIQWLWEQLHREISTIIEPDHGETPSHQRGAWRGPLAANGLFAAAGELEVPSEQELDVDGVVDRVGSTSFIAALPERDREDVLGRIRALASGWPEPLRLGYTTEASVYERR